MLDRARQLHHDSIVIDGLAATPSASAFRPQREGGVTAYYVSIASVYKANHISEVMLDFARALDLPRMHRGEVLLVETAADIERAKAEDRLGLIFGLQGLTQIGHTLHWIQILHKLGLRICGLTYNESNLIGNGCAEKVDNGLTYYGLQVVREMNRVGILVDLSHAGDRTSLDAVHTSDKPVVLSHSNPRRLVDHPRNAPDEVIKAVADRGGVIGLSQYGPLLDRGDGKLPTVETWLEHIDYAVELVGIDHVGIGTDSVCEVYSWSWWLAYMTHYRDLVPARYFGPELEGVNTHNVQGFGGNADLPKITEGLVQRGYPDGAVKKVLGMNLLRVYREVWTTP